MAPSRGGSAGGRSITGYIKTFNCATNWGFIICDEVDRDVFFHTNNCRGSPPEANVRPNADEKLYVEFQLDLGDYNKPKALGVRILSHDRGRVLPERDRYAGGGDRGTSREHWDRGRPWSGSRSSRSRDDPRRNGAPESRSWRGSERDGDRRGAHTAWADESRGGRRGGNRDGDRGRGCSDSRGSDREEYGSERGRGGDRSRAPDEGARRPPEGGQDSRPPLPRMRRRGTAQTASPSRLALRGAPPGDRLPERPPPLARSPPRPRGRSRSIQRDRDLLPPRPPRPVYPTSNGAAARGAVPSESSASRGAGPLPGSLPASWEPGGEVRLLLTRYEASALEAIERTSSARLRFVADPSRLHDRDLGSRVLCVSSSSGPSLRSAVKQVLSELERDTGADQELQVRLLVQRCVASHIIGARGNNIKDLCRGSGANVRIDQWPRDDGDELTETVAYVRGPARSVLNAVGWIHQTVQDRQDGLPVAGAGGRPRPRPEERGPPGSGARSRSPGRGRPRGAGAARPGAGAEAGGAVEGEGKPPEPPAPWRLEEHPDAPGEWYYLNVETGVTTWELPDEDAPPSRPPTPPPPYRLLEHPEAPGEWYYLNEETGDTCWELPVPAGVPARVPALTLGED